jgi:hypothetical protein
MPVGFLFELNPNSINVQWKMNSYLILCRNYGNKWEFKEITILFDHKETFEYNDTKVIE